MKEMLEALIKTVRTHERMSTQRVNKNLVTSHRIALESLQKAESQITEDILQKFEELSARIEQLEKAYINAMTS